VSDVTHMLHIMFG